LEGWKMKILYHHRTLGDGAEGIHIAEMVNAFRQLGHQVRVKSLIGEQTNVTTQKTKRLERLKKPLPRSVYELMEIGYNLFGYRALSREARSFRPDFIYDRYITYNQSAIWAAHYAGIPVVLEVNAPLAYERAQYETLCFPRLAQAMERHICKAADVTIVVSTPLKRHLMNIGVPESKLVVMPNGVNLEKFSPNISDNGLRAQLGISNRIVIGFVGILRDWHRVDLLLDALAMINWERLNLHVLIVGDGPAEQQLKEQAAGQGLHERVSFTGRVPHAEICHYIAAMDIAVSPHATPYASPMKILEYMAMGKVVVAPDMENIRDIITNGWDGILFEPENVTVLSSCLTQLSTHPETRQQLSQSARETIEKGRTWQHNAKRVIEIVQSIRQMDKS
jgi:glycosyltransferase involved in cell wall biosynthesis